MSLSATLFGRDSAIFKATNILGLGIPGWLDKKFGAKDVEIEGPRLSDLSVQTSTYGADIPRLYGTIAVMGNLLWLENGALKETARKNKSRSGSKGGSGGSTEPTTTYTYSATFHLALCEGPIAGIRRMWCGDKLIYNAGSNDLDTIIASNQAANGWKLYLGSDDQMPDSRFEASVGVGNASANRGLAYIAFYDFQLADYSNSLQGSQFKVEVMAQLDLGDDLIAAYTINKPHNAAAFGLPINSNGQAFAVRQTDSSVVLDQYRDGVATQSWVIDPGINDTSVLPFSASLLSFDFAFNNYKLSGFGTPQVYFGTTSNIRKIVMPEGNAITYFAEIAEEGCVIQMRDFSSMHSLRRYSSGPLGVVTLEASIDIAEPACIHSIGQELFTVRRDGTSGPLTIERRSIDDLSILSTETHTLSVAGSISPDNNCWVNDGILYVSIGIFDENVNLFGYSPALSQVVSYHYVSTAGYISGFTDPRAASTCSIGDLFGWGQRLTGGDYSYVVFRVNSNAGNLIQLSQVISTETELTSLLSSDDIDTSLVSGLVTGYRVSGGSIRSSLGPLQQAYHFDAIQSGYKIKFITRGLGSVVTVDQADIGGGDGESGILQQSREMDPQLPAHTTVTYLDADREYAIGEQYSDRLNTEAVNRVKRELALVLSADQAAGVAEVLQGMPWLQRTDFSFTLPPTYSYLEPADTVTLPMDGAIYELFLTEKNTGQDGRLECSAKQARSALYTPTASGGDGVVPDGTIGLAGQTYYQLLDIPVVDESVQDDFGFIAAFTGYTDGWPGGTLFRSIDDGQTWVTVQGFVGKATIGTASDLLPGSDCTLIDQRAITVNLISGELESISRDQMLAGNNYAAYGVNGRWEIVRFQNATLQVDGSYLVSGFLRGERGTEWASGLHEDNDIFVLLDDPDLEFISMSAGTLMLEMDYRGITQGSSIDSAANTSFTYDGVNLECPSPIYPNGSRDGSGNFTGTFTRRSRLSSSWWANGIQAPLGEASESYEVDVMSGATVLRTIEVTTPAFSYSAADQTTDFGSAQSSIAFRIYQLSAAVGRGYPLEVTL